MKKQAIETPYSHKGKDTEDRREDDDFRMQSRHKSHEGMNVDMITNGGSATTTTINKLGFRVRWVLCTVGDKNLQKDAIKASSKPNTGSSPLSYTGGKTNRGILGTQSKFGGSLHRWKKDGAMFYMSKGNFTCPAILR
ncbi:hypothetical protein Ancab_012007 [Ancistrocladus abbreviatus]